MAKEIVKKIKLQMEAGRATSAPPVGTVLGPAGINLQEFCTRFNEETKEMMGDIVPAEISIYDDRSFSFVIKTSPAAFLLKKASGVKKATAICSKETVGSVTKKQVREIAEKKLVDLNAYDIEAAIKIIEGTAKSMGIEIKEE